MSLIAIILLILALFGFGTFTTGQAVSEPTITVGTVESTTWETVTLDGIQGVIVATDEVAAFGVSEPYWDPTQADVAVAEEAITALEGELPHYRQYAGFTEDGDRKILINGFCTAESDWTSRVVFVMDGGDCYFTSVYNVETDELEFFMYNGEA